MIDSMSLAEVAEAERFERTGMEAGPRAASLAREAFADWLERYFDLDPIRSADLVLAVNEALANAAEFAYLRAEHPGRWMCVPTMTRTAKGSSCASAITARGARPCRTRTTRLVAGVSR